MHTPASTYKLNMTNGTMTNSVIWTDDKIANNAKADKLRELINLINETIQSHPEMQQLPKPNAAVMAAKSAKSH